MGGHKRRNTRLSDVCRKVSEVEYAKNGNVNRKGKLKKARP